MAVVITSSPKNPDHSLNPLFEVITTEAFSCMALTKLKNKYANLVNVEVITKDKLTLKTKGIVEKQKTKEGYLFRINSKELKISEFLNIISKKIEIDDIEIENENIDEVIVKLYEEYNI